MRVYKIKVNGKNYEVKVMSVSEETPIKVEKPKEKEKIQEDIVHDDSDKLIVSPMQGTILDVKVKVGEEVRIGDTIVILEAMKLENEVKSNFNGKVAEIKVNKGQQVNSKEVLVVVK